MLSLLLALTTATIAIQADPLGRDDAGAAINAAILSAGPWIGTQVEARDLDFILPAGSFVVRTPIVFTNMMGARFRGAGPGPTTLYWDGPAGVPMVEIRDSTHFSMSGMELKAASIGRGQKLTAIVLIHRTCATYDPGYGNWENHFEDLILGGDAHPDFTFGVEIRSECDGNNDFHTFNRVEVDGEANTEADVSLEATQSVGNSFTDCRMSGGKRGVANTAGWPPQFRGGKFDWTGGSMGHHTIADFEIGPGFYGFTIRNLFSNGSARLLQVPGPNNNSMPVLIEGGYWDAYGMAANDPAFVLMSSPGPLTIRGMTYGGGHPAGLVPIVRPAASNAVIEMSGNACRAMGSAGQWPVSVYPPSASSATNNMRLRVYNNLGLDAAGAEAPMRELEAR